MKMLAATASTILGLFSLTALAQLPNSDIANSGDSSVVGRYSDSIIIDYNFLQFDEVTFPLSTLQRSETRERDVRNNVIYRPEKSITLSGKHTRIIYLLPQNTTPIQAVRNYENELKANGGNVLFSCEASQCGGDQKRGSIGGGGNMSLPLYLWPERKISSDRDSIAFCAQNRTLSGITYSVIELPEKNSHISVLAYQLSQSKCDDLKDRTVAIVQVLESDSMKQTMVAPKANEIKQALQEQGRIALYGIYFDSGRSEVKPESNETLEQITLLMKTEPEMKLIVVGHTDSDGSYDSNLALSKRRAEAVVNSLNQQFGISRKRLRSVGVSYASPVATNSSGEGKAKNRRVELVPDK